MEHLHVTSVKKGTTGTVDKFGLREAQQQGHQTSRICAEPETHLSQYFTSPTRNQGWQCGTH